MSGKTITAIKSVKSKFSDLKLNYKIWMENPEGKSIMGDGKYHLLKSIEKEGSLMAAIHAEGLDYRRTWDNLKKIETTLGFSIIEKTRGGKDGGKTELTVDGKKLVKAFDSLHARMDKYFSESMEQFFSELE